MKIIGSKQIWIHLYGHHLLPCLNILQLLITHCRHHQIQMMMKVGALSMAFYEILGQERCMVNQGYEDDYYDNYDGADDDDSTDVAYGRREEKLARRTQIFYCEVCNVSCTGEPTYQQHLDGRNHKRRIGLDEATPNQTNLSKNCAAYRCEVCNINCNNEDNYHIHINGQKHKKAIMVLLKTNKPIPSNEMNITLPAESSVSDEGRGSQNGDNKQGTRKRPNSVDIDNINPNLVPIGTNTIRTEAINDRHLLDKLEQIGLNPEQEQIVEEFVLLVEDALYDVSVIIEEERSSIPVIEQNQTENRVLRGVMRVGILANKLLLKTDQRIDLVVLCSVVPTTELLFQVFEHFRRIVNQNVNNNMETKKIIYTSAVVNESALSISQEGIPIVLFVTFTCSIMRQWSPGDLNYHPYVIPPNALPKEPCLYALAEMRRTKYYQIKCEPHASMNCVAKLVRDFVHRVPAWRRLNDWMIVLIVEKIFSNSENSLGPSAALKALFKALSEGYITGANYKLPDPCEKFPIDAIVTLTQSDRTQLYSSARYALRQMNTNNLARLLALSSGIPTEPIFKKKKLVENATEHGKNVAPLSTTSGGIADSNNQITENSGNNNAPILPVNGENTSTTT